MVDDAARRQAGEAWNRIVGPFYSRDTVAEALEISSERLDELIAMGDVLQLVRHGRTFLPAFQFADDGALLPGLRAVHAMLNPDGDPELDWDVTRWLCEPKPAFGGATSVEMLGGGHIPEVLAVARAATVPGRSPASGT